MLIDVSDVSTIPMEIKDKVIQSIEALPYSIVNKMKSEEVSGNNSIMCAIENYYKDFRNTNEFNEIIGILEKNDIVCYHATKVSSFSKILKDGLKINDWNIYCSNLETFYLDIGFSEIEVKKVVDIVKREYDRKYSSICRKAQLCFFSNLSMIRGTHATYTQFCESIGGELARRALKDKYPELYKPLKENGKSCVVKFRLPYSSIAEYEKGSIACHFFSYYFGVYLWNKEYEIKFDGNTQFNVPANDIIRIIDSDNEDDY